MAVNPTVIVGHINDEELKNSIAKLVQNVNEGTQAMAKSFDSTIDHIVNRLKDLGNQKVNIGGNKGQGSGTSRQKKEVKELVVSYDELATAQHKAFVAQQEKRYNVSEIQQYRMQLHELEVELQKINQRKPETVWGAFRYNTAYDIADIKQYEEYVKRIKNDIQSLTTQRDAFVQQREIEKAKELNTKIKELKADLHSIQTNRIDFEHWEAAFKKTSGEVANVKAQIQGMGNAMLEETRKVANAEKNISEEKQRQRQQEQEAIERLRGEYVAMEQKRREENIKSASVAQENAQKIIQSMYAQAQSGEQKPIMGIKELHQAIDQMNKAYWSMDKEQRESPIGQALKRDIETAEKAKTAIIAYNKTLAGLPFGKQQAVHRAEESYIHLDGQLKQLIHKYKEMDSAERASSMGVGILEKIQKLRREIDLLNKEMNRPTSLKNIMGLDENTLDNIAYKIRQLQAYKQGINLTNPNAANEMQQVDDKIKQLSRDLQKYTQDVKRVQQENNALTRSWNYMKNRLAFYFTVGASTQFIRNLIEVRSQYEMNERALGILVNSAERGTQIFNELSQMALVSPYTLIELSAAAKQLVAYDVAAKDVVDTTRRLADMSSAVGVPIDRLTYALGQIKAYGYLNSRDARMFANAGIPLVKQLADHFTELEGRMVSTADVYDRIKKKAIGYNDVMEVITRMTDEGGKFFNFQAKMADTLKVKLANLTLAWNNMLNDIGKETQGILSWTIGALRTLFLHWKDLDDLMKKALWAGGAVAGIRLLVYWINLLGRTMGATWAKITIVDQFGKRIGGFIRSVSLGIKSLATSSAFWTTLVVAAMAGMVVSIAEGNKAQRELNESIRDGAKSSYEELSKFFDQYNELYESLYKRNGDGKIIGTQDIDNNEAKKAWESMREQIELSTKMSDEYLGRLMQIENVSERLRQGFAVLESVKVVEAALAEIDDDTIKITKDWSEWWNLWLASDGMIGNLKDYKEELDDVNEAFGTYQNAIEAAKNGTSGAEAVVHDVELALSRLKDDLKETTDSIINFINLKGWQGDPDKINETFNRTIGQIAEKNQLSPQEAFQLQLATEEARTQALMNALAIRYNDEMAAAQKTEDEKRKLAYESAAARYAEEYNLLKEQGGKGEIYWADFTKWMKEQHMHEMREAFRGMDAEQIASINFEEGEWAKFVNTMVTKYSREHKMSYDEAFGYLRHWITNANQWSIFIPLIISTEGGKSVYDVLNEADSEIDKADKQIERLDKRIKSLKDKQKKTQDEEKELAKAEKERQEAEDDRNKAIEKGGISKKDEKEAKKAAKEAEKQRKASAREAAKAQREAESELQKAFKDELQLIDKVRSQYKKLTDAGVGSQEAITMVTNQFSNSIKQINSVLGKNGLPLFDLKTFAGTDDPNKVLAMLNAQLAAAKTAKNVKPVEIKDLEVKIGELTIDARVYNTKKIAEGLNNELTKLKEEYELAIELDANPELGNIFAAMMGIDEEQLKSLPRDVEQAMQAIQPRIDNEMKKMGVSFNLAENLRKDVFDAWANANNLEMDSDVVKALDAMREYFNKARVDETKKQTEEWNKLLEKYAEYEYKRKQITETYEREMATARKKNASADIFDAIINKYKQDMADLDFEQFQKYPSWLTATGDLATLTDKALSMLIDDIVEFKRRVKDLSPKQIKQINTALRNLRKQQRQGNPFAAIANAIDEAKERMEDYQPAIDEVEGKIQKLLATQMLWGISTKGQGKELSDLIDELKKLKGEQEEVGKINFSSLVEGFNAVINVINQVTSMFGDMAEAIGGKGMTKAAQTAKDVVGILEKAGQGAQIGAQFGGWGAAIGAVAGGLMGLVTTMADVWSGNRSITKKIEASENEVRRLEVAYIDLEHAVDKAYGTGIVGANKLALANKELQLAELRRQLELEKSRKKKNRDDERILELEKDVKELEYEIADGFDDIVNNLLGISSVGDAMESLMDEFVEALRNGENAMDTFNESIDDMIANMVKKMFTTKILQPWFEKQWDEIQKQIDDRSSDIANQMAANRNAVDITQRALNGDGYNYIEAAQAWGMSKTDATKLYYTIGRNAFAEFLKKKLQNASEAYDELQEEYDTQTAVTTDDIRRYAELLRSGQPIMEGSLDEIRDLLVELNLMKSSSSSSSSLSALQQGIQGITEETAGALEAYMNSVSQQVYLHSDILTQIRDAVIGFDLDVQTATVSQILLQLQSTYQVQMAIQSTLNGWSTPNGLAVRVEMQ